MSGSADPKDTDLHLRPWTEDDDAALLAIFAASDDLDTQYPAPVVDLAGARRAREQMLVTERLAGAAERYAFAIVADGVPVGNVGVSGISRRHDTAWISYFISGEVRGRGLVRRALCAVGDWCLGEAGLYRLELGHRTNNPASGAVAEAAGFIAEGIERKKLRYGTTRYDVRTMARLASDPAPRLRAGEAAVPIRF